MPLLGSLAGQQCKNIADRSKDFRMRVDLSTRPSRQYAFRAGTISLMLTIRPACRLPRDYECPVDGEVLVQLLRQRTDLPGYILEGFERKLSSLTEARLQASNSARVYSPTSATLSSNHFGSCLRTRGQFLACRQVCPLTDFHWASCNLRFCRSTTLNYSRTFLSAFAHSVGTSFSVGSGSG